MRGTKAKPLAFFIGIVVLGVSVFGFAASSSGLEEQVLHSTGDMAWRLYNDFGIRELYEGRLIYHSLSLAGIVVAAILVAYGLIPFLHIGGEGEREPPEQ
ncbi:MAG: hypothetical protein ABID84_04065 [Chloroflexota bacterium]